MVNHKAKLTNNSSWLEQMSQPLCLRRKTNHSKGSSQPELVKNVFYHEKTIGFFCEGLTLWCVFLICRDKNKLHYVLSWTVLFKKKKWEETTWAWSQNTEICKWVLAWNLSILTVLIIPLYKCAHLLWKINWKRKLCWHLCPSVLQINLSFFCAPRKSSIWWKCQGRNIIWMFVYVLVIVRLPACR